MTTRRQVLRLGMASLALASAPMGCALFQQPTGTEHLLFSAANTPEGNYTLVGLDSAGQVRSQVTVGDRCHGGCQRPGSRQVLLFARRPGRHFYVIDTLSGQLLASIDAEPDHHFYGHGAFSPDGRYLYTTENHYPSGQGVIGVYDASTGYTRVRQLAAGGIGPHEVRMHPDGNTLVVALGGIQTHPDYQRIKLNLETMSPALLLIDRHDGTVLQRHEPSHQQLSCRHLDVSPDGTVIAGYQFQGPEWQAPPLIARLDSQRGDFRELSLGDGLQSQLRNYTASIAVHPYLPLSAITAPRGGKLLVINHRSGELAVTYDVDDCAGIMAAGQRGFLLTSGTGAVFQLPANLGALIPLQAPTLRWDNHLTAVTVA
ncbi:DUF1513 domain-containing protein [Marinobacter zhejiangensis]|uniref:DUF1513 domain-containing protein n=1 Tax=Marinobacter zhejiangensis TaxID=488535 RepID=A0A1I4QF56_9GAMM|nr:DUF1513 domain-containing protein [Marinobacter zhejiangensis]SFM38365.1 hypothetical protein SAMN04487963_2343 [Marinobacter zhejiangensis]